MTPRILFVELSTVVGGSVVSLFELARGLTAGDRFEPVVLFDGPHPATAMFQGAGIRTLHLTPKRREVGETALGRRAREQVGAAAELSRLLASERFNLVHHNINLPRDRVNILAVAAADIPQVSHARNLCDLSPLDRLASRLPGCCVYVSRAVERHALGQGAAPRRRRVVYNPVDVDGATRGDGTRLRAELGLDPDRPVVSNIGRLESWKGQDVFLRAVPEVLRHHDVTALVVGELPARARAAGYDRRIRELVDGLRLGDHVVLTGHRTDVADILAASDVAVHSARAPEPFGRVIVEAMASGTPVIATGAGGVPEIVTDGEDGMLVPCGDPVALGSAIVALLDHPAEARRLGAAGRRTAADRFTVERHVATMTEVYAQVLGLGRGGGSAPVIPARSVA